MYRKPAAPPTGLLWRGVDLIGRNALASGFAEKTQQIEPGASALRLIERLNQQPACPVPARLARARDLKLANV